MKKLLEILLLIFLFAGSASGQWIWQQKPMLGQQSNRAHQLGDPVAAWFFLEGSGYKVFDLSRNGNGMDFVNSPVWSSGKFGSSILFDDGSSQYLTRSSAILTTTPFTVVAWFKTDDSAVNQYIFSITDTAGDDNSHQLVIRDTPDIDLLVQTKGGEPTVSAITTNTYTVDKWHQAVGIWRSSTSREVILDADFSNKGTDATDKTPVGLDTTSIGVLKRSVLYSYFSGQIDHVLIYNRALSASEIALLYREPFCMFAADDVAILEAAAPAPGGQVVFINTAKIPLILISMILLIVIKRMKVNGKES